MRPSEACLALGRTSEGLRLMPYQDPAGYWTIGRGHKISAVQAETLKDNGGISEQLADALYEDDMDKAADAVQRIVTVPLTQGQLDALTDLEFNLPAALEGSTLIRLLNAGDYDGACDQLVRWDHARVNGTEVELAGLKTRRLAEAALWKGETDATTPASS